MTQFQHPSDDLLADFAAEVLPPEEAVDLEAHILVCATCVQVLQDGEVVRNALLQVPMEAMPDDVLARLTDVLRIESDAREGLAVDPEAPARTPHSTWDETAQFTSVFSATAPSPASAPARPRSISRSAGAATRTLGALPAPGGPSRGSAAQRRLRASDSAPRSRGPRFFALAAAASVLVLGGAFAVHERGWLLGVNGSSSSSAASIAEDSPAMAGGAGTQKSPAAGATGIVRFSSKRSYHEAKFSSDAQLLYRQSTLPSVTELDVAKTYASSPLLKDAGLTACLKSVDAGDSIVIAVDFATFDGAQAAIILTTQDRRTIQAWAVSPDCGQGSQNALAVVQFSR